MLNVVTLVGRLVETPRLNVREGDLMVSTITLAVTRPFKNSDGEYDTDFIRCVLWEGIARNTCEYCQKGDIIGIRGRINSKTVDISFPCDVEVHKKRITALEVIAERVVFIQTSGKKSIDE